MPEKGFTAGLGSAFATHAISDSLGQHDGMIATFAGCIHITILAIAVFLFFSPFFRFDSLGICRPTCRRSW
jgi:hypothetical protein